MSTPSGQEEAHTHTHTHTHTQIFTLSTQPTHLTFLDSFSIPQPPRLLTLGLFFQSQEYKGEYSGFGPNIPNPEPHLS